MSRLKARSKFARRSTGSRSLPKLGRGADGARFGVEQDRPHHGLHVAAHAAAVVVEGRRDAADVGRARVAGHQALDQLLADERADVRVVEQRVERDLQVGRRSRLGLRRDRRAEEALLADRVEAVLACTRRTPASAASRARGSASSPRKRAACGR